MTRMPLPSGMLIGQECIAAAAAERKKRKALVTEPTVAFKARSPTLAFHSVGCLTIYSVLGLVKFGSPPTELDANMFDQS